MWYLIVAVSISLIGFFIYANIKRAKLAKEAAGKPDKPSFRSEEDLGTYVKPMDDKGSHVDFEDAE